MWSMEPDSSPMAHICSTMEGKTLALVMAAVRLVPVENSCWILSVAIAYTELPAAPPTESSASTRGTPAANMVDRVRVQRATADFSTSVPKIGTRSSSRSMNICTFSLRRHACMKKYTPPPMTPKINHHHLTKTSLMPITKRVGAGKSAPKDEKTSLNAGMTKIMITVTTTKATMSTEMGYISADLILLLMASVFSMYMANRSSSASRIPACSPASTRLQYRLSK